MKQFKLDYYDELIVDSFAGGGGASTGIELALGRSPDYAINHDETALAMHRANHPETVHLCESVLDVRPSDVTKGRPVGLLWLSPDCTHFSRAKGSKPRKRKIRGLAWTAYRWIRDLQAQQGRGPRVIILENVEEFRDWGPLDKACKPINVQRGESFKKYVEKLVGASYTVEHKVLRACDYGAPTIRKRLFLIARCDGQPIVWPAPTHGDGLKPHRTAAECIDWSMPCPSIFERKKPLAAATCRRIAKGTMKYVVDCADPYIAPAGAVVPFITEHANASSQRNMPANEPLRTQCAQVKGGHFALVSAFIAKHYTGVTGQTLNKPIGTVTSVDHHSVVAANLVRNFGQSTGLAVDSPAPTIMPNGLGKTSLATAHLCKTRGTNIGDKVDAPLHTISAGGTHHALVSEFLSTYYGNGSIVRPDQPANTITTKDRLNLVTVTIDGQTYAISDIGLRMFQPKELFAAQGFPEDYIHTWGYFINSDGQLERKPLTKTAQVKMCGNSVSPPLAAALAGANVPEMITHQKQNVA